MENLLPFQLPFPLTNPLPFPLPRMSRRRRNLLLACCAIGAGGYVSYRVYKSPSVTRKRLQLYTFFHSLSSLLENAAQGTDCVGLLWKDLHSFLLTNEDEVPQSLKQLFKVGQTREFQTSVALLCRSVTQGMVSSFSDQGRPSEDGSEQEELPSQRGVLSGGDSGPRNRKKERRRAGQGETDTTLQEDADEDNHSGGEMGQTENASRFEGEEGDQDEAMRYPDGSGPSIRATSGTGSRRQGRPGEKREEGLSERLLVKIFSEPGRGFASVLVASATRSLVSSVLEGIRETNILGQNNWGIGEEKEEENNAPNANEEEGNGGKSDDGRKEPSGSSSSSTFQDGMINFVCSKKGKTLIADCIETFVGTAVSVYLDKTRDVNVYEEILTTVSNPAHRDSVKELLTSVCNGAMETLIRASHDALAGASASSNSSVPPPQQSETGTAQFVSRRDVRRLTFSLGKSSCFNQLDQSDVGDSGDCGPCEGGNDSFVPASPPPWSPDSRDSESLNNLSGLRTSRIAFDHSPLSEKKVPPLHALDTTAEAPLSPVYQQKTNGKEVMYPSYPPESSQGWVDGVSRTLAVPSNRALVLDVAGTVTAEAVRSAIDAVLCKVSLTLRGGKDEQGSTLESTAGPSKIVRVVNRTGHLAQATASRALVAMTMCLAICLHTLLGESKILEHA